MTRVCSANYYCKLKMPSRQWKDEPLCISCNKMKVMNSLYYIQLKFCFRSNLKPFLNFFIDRYKEAYKIQLNDLVSLTKKNIKPRSTFYDGYEALKLANAAQKSIILKRAVKLTK